MDGSWSTVKSSADLPIHFFWQSLSAMVLSFVLWWVSLLVSAQRSFPSGFAKLIAFTHT